MTDWRVLALAIVPGLALGSFAVTAGLRFAAGESVASGRSRCDACRRSLNLFQSLPIVSYAGLRGACAHCGARIDPTHLAGELAGAAVLLTALAAQPGPRAVPLVVLGLALVAAATVDGRVRRLPDIFTGLVAAATLCLAALGGADTLLAGAAAAVISTLVLLAVRAVSGSRGGAAGLGLGDVKLVAALAFWLGAQTPVMILVASILGLAAAPVLRDADGRLPFGPFLALAAWGVGVAAEAGWAPWPL